MRYVILLKERKGDGDDDEATADPYDQIFRSRFGSASCRVQYVPVLQLAAVVPPDLPPALAQQPYQAVILTSANTIRYLPDSISLSSYPRCYSVGRATTRQIQGRYAGLDVRTGPPPESAAALADFIIQDLGAAAGPVLFLCGDPHRPELTERLTRAGVLVRELVVYESRPRSDLAERLRSLPIDSASAADDDVYIVVFSGEGGRALLNQVGEAELRRRRYRLVAIGRSTASVLGRYYPGPVLVASEPSPAGVLQCILDDDRASSGREY